ncbi:hypothetical protein NDU88_005148 [Pleurodeles waltl]|uniref:Reverse transcriptase domain-containing protein n=1 Tax=Pleurodeles waltl TaxID=8319 RepID=A0AAV7MX71_PLEWA|nr:hypothetical protein NDU88_005148 [Pleurodeles waltl]
MELNWLLFQSFELLGKVPRSWTETNIVIFPKKGKDPLLCGSFQPISLIYADSKIYKCVLANELATLISDLVAKNQHSFVPGRDTTAHVNTVITALEASRAHGNLVGPIMLDAEKAFDRILWPFLCATVAASRFSLHFTARVQQLHQNIMARVSCLGSSTDLIQINCSTCHECPLFPLLFVIYINRHIRALISLRDITPLRIHQLEFKVLAYADDHTILTSAPEDSLVVFEDVASKYGAISEYKRNLDKTVVLGEDIDCSTNACLDYLQRGPPKKDIRWAYKLILAAKVQQQLDIFQTMAEEWS